MESSLLGYAQAAFELMSCCFWMLYKLKNKDLFALASVIMEE